jgi:adenine/guanine phosphoribosyltransferase-like PRPP-binding protein
MTQERLSLRKEREVLRLKHEVGLSNRAIARLLRFNKRWGNICSCQAKGLGLAAELAKELSTVVRRKKNAVERPSQLEKVH